jgi:hypothetical protein
VKKCFFSSFVMVGAGWRRTKFSEFADPKSMTWFPAKLKRGSLAHQPRPVFLHAEDPEGIESDDCHPRHHE